MFQAKTAGSAARVFTEQPERLAAAWRRERFTDFGGRSVPDNLIDGVVEDFVRQLGRALLGESGHPWSRTRGVLRASVARGAEALAEEFETLRRCLYDALSVANAPPGDLALVTAAVTDAQDACAALVRRLENPALPGPRIPFGGLVIELVEPNARPAAGRNVPASLVH